MGPLVPDHLEFGLSLVIALLLGVAFGFILEQSGFSSSRRLAGLFYGRDFVVLRVFFTAAITAMGGIILLGYLGLLNLDIIYVNPTFLRSAIVGGVIMGAGFIIGGFCPGTSACAAAIGKLDAWFFIFGLFLGIFLFAEAYPVFHDFLFADSYGDLLVYKALGLTRGFFAFLIVVFALAAFVAVDIIERKVNGLPSKPFFSDKRNTLVLTSAIVLGLVLSFLPDVRTRAMNYIESDRWQKELKTVEFIKSDELVFHLMDEIDRLTLVDLRSPEEFKEAHLPFAVNIPFDSLANGAWRDLLKASRKETIFYAANGEDAARGEILSRRLGDNKNARALAGGFDQFRMKYLTDVLPDAATTPSLVNFYRHAQAEMKRLLAKESAKPVVPKKKRRVQGGC